MNWELWNLFRHGRSSGIEAAEEQLVEAKQEREEMEKLRERHRKVRAENHLGFAAAQSMRKRS